MLFRSKLFLAVPVLEHVSIVRPNLLCFRLLYKGSWRRRMKPRVWRQMGWIGSNKIPISGLNGLGMIPRRGLSALTQSVAPLFWVPIASPWRFRREARWLLLLT